MARRVIAVGGLLMLALGGMAWARREMADSGILQSVTVGPSPSSVVVDEQSGFAFVLSASPDRADAATVNMIDTATGALRRTYTLTQMPQALALDSPAHRVVVATGSNVIVALDARSGALVYRRRVPGATSAATTLAIAERAGHVFVAGDQSVSMLDAASGRVRRTIALTMFISAMAVDAQRDHLYVTGYNGTIAGGIVRVLDVRSGRVRHTIALPQSPDPGPIAVDERSGRVVIIDRSIDSVSVLDTTRAGVWDVHTFNNVGASLYPQTVAIDERTGRVFVALCDDRHDGRVRTIEARSGRIVRTVQIGGEPSALVVDTRAGRVVMSARSTVSGEAGRISILDATSGRLMRTIPVALTPRAAAVDERTGRIVIAGDMSSGATRPTEAWGWVPPWVQRWLPLRSTPARQRPAPLDASSFSTCGVDRRKDRSS